jgi:D-glycero-D-manno-heptose 1,7-bisphosphate phosphatase
MTPPLDRGHGALLARALFVDMAGVLLEPVATDDRPGGRQTGLRAGVGAALRLLDRLDYRIVVLAPCALDRRRAAHVPPARIADLLARERIDLVGVCCCHAVHGPCVTCPPAPGTLLRAAREHAIDLTQSWLVASEHQHCTAGQQAGCRTLLIAGNDGWRLPAMPDAGTGTGMGESAPAAYQARDIFDAALAIVRLDGSA